MIKKAVIFANTTKLNTNKVSKEIKAFLKTKGVSSKIVELSSDLEDSKIKGINCDFAISLGGDGTVLTCAEILDGTETPLLAINMGTFGYIAGTSVDEYKDVIEDFLSGKTEPTKRMRLAVTVSRGTRKVFEGTALNDISVSSASRAKTARLNLNINGTFAASLKCDGIIVASPTGSTAYNLSAGGPILEETLNSIVVNPICSFTLNARPLVIDQDSEVLITVPEQSSKIVISADGHVGVTLKYGDVVTITKSSCPTLLVKNSKRNSIEILRDKLGWAGGFNA